MYWSKSVFHGWNPKYTQQKRKNANLKFGEPYFTIWKDEMNNWISFFEW